MWANQSAGSTMSVVSSTSDPVNAAIYGWNQGTQRIPHSSGGFAGLPISGRAVNFGGPCDQLTPPECTWSTLSMDPERARSLSQLITRSMNIQNHGDWENLDYDALRGWAGELLARLISAIGNEDPLYISGWAEDDDRIEGAVAIFTRTRLIRARFDVANETGRGILNANVTVVSRKRVRRSSVLKAGSLPVSSTGSWPTRASVSLTLRGEEDPLVLPLTKRTPIPDAATAAYVSNFLGQDRSSTALRIEE